MEKMRIYLLVAVICLSAIHTNSSPIVITAHEDEKPSSPLAPNELEVGKTQEETTGVFKDTALATLVTEASKEQSTSSEAKTPVAESSTNSLKETEKPKQTGRQSTDEDDDDDDDDDDLDLGVDDDDDDDDADDDDDDDDYFDGIFDDILGEDDDDDDDDDEDDDDEESAQPVAPSQAVAEEVVPVAANAEEEYEGEEEVVEEGETYAAGAIQTHSVKMPAVYVAKYNRFVDNVIGRMNRILRKSYDPVRVKLVPNTSSKTKSKNNKRKPSKSNNKNKKNKRQPSRRTPGMSNKMVEVELSRAHESETREPAFVLISKASDVRTPTRNNTMQVRASTSNKKKKKTSNKIKTKNTLKATTRARATLFGLSTLKRDGDVSVEMKTNYTTVKSNFVVGPLTLRVEKEFGRGANRELKSATATTAEMYGKLNLRIVHGGAATLHSIRVLQPKQVRVDSADNHEKTKEFMWKRSARIAKVVSRKLAIATKSMLKPPPLI